MIAPKARTSPFDDKLCRQLDDAAAKRRGTGDPASVVAAGVVEASGQKRETAAAHAASDKRAKRSAAASAPPPQGPNGSVEGGYSMTAAGLFWTDPDDPHKPHLRLCGPFEVLAETRNGNGEAWGILLGWRDHDGRPHEWALPRSMLAGDCSEMRARLLDGGLYVTQNRKGRELFAAYLANKRVEMRARCVEAIGWHGHAYVTPKEVFGDTAGEKVILQTIAAVTEFESKGTFEDWKRDIAALAEGNSRLALALSVAFVGPLLHLVGEESHGFHFSGGSSSGKTTALRVAASVMGAPLHTWRTTDNAAEGLARAANDGLLLLDELSQVDGRAADAMAYMLGNGQGKGRMRKDTSNKPVSSWRLAFLSTGEVGLAEKIGETGKRAKAGQSVRMIEVPADAGKGHKLFETLHRFTGGDDLARHLRTATDSHRGHALRPFLVHITANLSAVTDALKAEIRRWLADNLPPKADGQVSRVASRFALAAAAGQLATDIGVLPWPKDEARRAAATCFRAWLNHRGGTGAAETEAGLSQVRAFIEMHGEARFAPTDKPDSPRIINRAGFVREDDTGRLEYLVLPEAWKNEVCKGLDAVAVARDLAGRGLLRPDAGGKSSRSVTIPGLGKVRVYVLASHILEGTE